MAYRDLTSEGVRDIRLATSPDGGATWSPGGPVSEDGWAVDACPHTGPRLAHQPAANGPRVVVMDLMERLPGEIAGGPSAAVR